MVKIRSSNFITILAGIQLLVKKISVDIKASENERFPYVILWIPLNHREWSEMTRGYQT